MPASRAPHQSGTQWPGRRPPRSAKTAAGGQGERWIYGRHTVAAALANPERRWRRLAVLTGQETEAQRLVAAAVAERCGSADQPGLAILDREAFSALLPADAVHQGLALEVEPLPEPTLDQIMHEAATAAGRVAVVALDQVSDPHNVGAVLRSAAAFNARAVVLTSHGGAPVTGALAKAASGALDRVPLIRAVNLVRALERLKQAGFWVCGLDETAAQPLAEIDLGQRAVLVLGSESGGLRRLVREHCDFLARLPTSAAQPSLNVSNAAAVALYELARRIAAD